MHVNPLFEKAQASTKREPATAAATAKKYDLLVPKHKDYPADQMRIGKEIEKEHTTNPEIAKLISEHHLDEFKTLQGNKHRASAKQLVGYFADKVNNYKNQKTANGDMMDYFNKNPKKLDEKLVRLVRSGEKNVSDFKCPGIRKRVKALLEKKASNILITGYPGAGKTTISKQLSKKHNKPIVHLDDILRTHVTKDQWADKAKMTDEQKQKLMTELKRHKNSVIEGTMLLHKKFSPDGKQIGAALKGKKYFLDTPREVARTRKAQRSLNKRSIQKHIPIWNKVYLHKKKKKDESMYNGYDPLVEEYKNRKDVEKIAGKHRGLADHYLKRYDKLDDPAHGRLHIEAVRRHAQEIAKSVKYKKSGVLDLAAVLHDIGNLKNRDLHHLIGPDMIKADKKLNKEVAPQTLKAILNAVRSHRASDTATPPKSQLAKIVNDADRLDSTLGRALVYRLKKFPNMKMDDAVLDAAKHHTGKYGPKGYGLKATYFPRTTKIMRDSMVEINKAFSKKDVKKLTEIAQACNYYKSFIGKADKSPS